MQQSGLFKNIGLVCLLVLLLVPAWGCSKQAKQETLLVAGSSTILPYMEKLKAGFAKTHPNYIIEAQGGGSTAGLIAVRRGAIDLATMSREVRRDEDDPYTRDYLVGKDAVAIVVHPANPVANLSKEQLRGIFDGSIANWRQVGGEDAPILVVGRKAGSTTRKAVDEMVLDGLDFAKSAINAESAEAVAKRVAENPSAIGYLALKDLQKTVRAVDVAGVPVARETILSGRYLLSRDFYLVLYDKPKPAVQKFIDYVMGKEGQGILEHEGLIRVY